LSKTGSVVWGRKKKGSGTSSLTECHGGTKKRTSLVQYKNKCIVAQEWWRDLWISSKALMLG